MRRHPPLAAAVHAIEKAIAERVASAAGIVHVQPHLDEDGALLALHLDVALLQLRPIGVRVVGHDVHARAVAIVHDDSAARAALDARVLRVRERLGVNALWVAKERAAQVDVVDAVVENLHSWLVRQPTPEVPRGVDLHADLHVENIAQDAPVDHVSQRNDVRHIAHLEVHCCSQVLGPAEVPNGPTGLEVLAKRLLDENGPPVRELGEKAQDGFPRHRHVDDCIRRRPRHEVLH
mmetsp:Transcript_19623/g.75316  ORF Transcript_19623/g.75316 Transcript_19623/m.75316 type:complete len:235 (-) Transcript_19623:252-956(-)